MEDKSKFWQKSKFDKNYNEVHFEDSLGMTLIGEYDENSNLIYKEEILKNMYNNIHTKKTYRDDGGVISFEDCIANFKIDRQNFDTLIAGDKTIHDIHKLKNFMNELKDLDEEPIDDTILYTRWKNRKF